MNLKRSPFIIQDKNSIDIDIAKEFSTLWGLMKEQGFSNDLADYWEMGCELNPANPDCLLYDD